MLCKVKPFHIGQFLVNNALKNTANNDFISVVLKQEADKWTKYISNE